MVPSVRQMGTNDVDPWENRRIACRIIGGVARLTGKWFSEMKWEWGIIRQQHADAKMQMRGWMNAVYGFCRT